MNITKAPTHGRATPACPRVVTLVAALVFGICASSSFAQGTLTGRVKNAATKNNPGFTPELANVGLSYESRPHRS